ncbi:aaa family ATPase [Grosmannia clavigera kw1407]|uniref:Aaa family ATPase n=1 Tax=Grosmannia clavigera (strain kw1407 / UAMH 11150) TaxID=655863 RepID=F0XNF6_GROCL|nr:aaa family ATPase [Grosmannia clavigera kw1407]EFX00795.1 aaa family ATPase [Grosmannia clavigera kw1407]
MLHTSSSAASSLQRIYEDGYLKCSTAVYYEGQGNEEEAMRCWRSAVEQIRHQCSETAAPDFAALSESEKSLVNSLQELEYQAQERVDLLEALRLSRRDSSIHRNGSPTGAGSTSGTGMGTDLAAGAGWIGGGTIPAVKYGELSRPLPAVPPPAPSSAPPPIPPRRPVSNSQAAPSKEPAPSLPEHGIRKSNSGTANGLRYDPRSPSREKQHTLRPTLRTGNSGEARRKSHRSSNSKPSSDRKSTSERMGASKAATLAWSALGFSSGRTESPRTPTSTEPPSLPKLRDDSPSSSTVPMQWDSNSRRLVPQRPAADSIPVSASRASLDSAIAAAIDGRGSGEYAAPYQPSSLSLNAAASALSRSLQSAADSPRSKRSSSNQRPSVAASNLPSSIERGGSASNLDYAKPKSTSHRFAGGSNTPTSRVELRRNAHSSTSVTHIVASPLSASERNTASGAHAILRKRIARGKENAGSRIDPQTNATNQVSHLLADVQLEPSSSDDSDKLDGSQTPDKDVEGEGSNPWKKRKQAILKHLPPGVDDEAAKQILNEIVVQGDVVHWSDIAGLEPAKKALREAVVYPFLRPDLFMGLREPATGMLLFGPPGTGKTMLARAVATESRSTFFSISASSLTSKYLGESEKLVRALFVLAKTLAPSIIFVDEIDSILSQRSGSGEHEATRRIKTEFLIQWSDLQRAAAGREDKDAARNGDASRVLVLAATNLPWAIDEAARRRFVRRQYIPLPEAETRAVQLQTLLGQQKHNLGDDDIHKLVTLTDGFSGSDITALAKDAAMGPLRSLGEALLMMKMDEIRPMELSDFIASLQTIRPSVSRSGLKEYEDWAGEFGERGG